VTLAHLPALVVVVPLLAAPLAVLLRRSSAAWAIASAACAFSFAAALLLAAEVAAQGPISYHLGSWSPPWGIEYRVDALSAFVLVLVSGIGTLTALYAWRSIAAELPRDQLYLYYAMHCLCVAGLLGMTITGDAFNLFVFMEIASLSSYVLIALGEVAALAFITVGVSLKLALFPLHFWLPNAYAYAPSAVTAFLAATATKVSVYVLLRFYFGIFGLQLVTELLPMREILLALSLVAILTASLVALWQADLKRLFAYSSVAQIGYITLGISMASHDGLTAAVVHLFNHGITKGALFLLIGGIALRARGASLECARGLGRSMPLTSLGVVIAGLSLIGVPGTAGFVSKWYLVLGAIEAGSWWLVAFVVATSLIAAAYVWRFVEAAYLSAPGARTPEPGETPATMLVPAWILVAACVGFGLQTSWSVGTAQRAAALLLGGAP